MGDHVPPDEDVPDEWCGNPEPHDDHYWRKDRKRFRYLDDPTVRYCHPALIDGSSGVDSGQNEGTP